MSAFYAEDFDREFYLGLIIGGRADSQPLWLPERWPEWTNSLERLVSSARAAPGIGGCIIKNWNAPPSMDNFAAVSAKQWREPLPTSVVLSSWNLFAPSNQKCARERRCPDVYSSLSNLRQMPQFPTEPHTFILFAIGADLPQADELLDGAMANIAASISVMMTAKTRRPWGFGTEIGYNNGISETQWLRGSLLGRKLTPHVLYEKWEHVEIVGEGKPTSNQLRG